MPKKSATAEAREQKRRHDAWNHPVGTIVEVTKDLGDKIVTKTLSMPWMLGASSRGPGHTAVIMVEGITGGYLLSRVRPLRPDEIGPLVTVCASCRRASCWYAEFMCDDARTANVEKVPRVLLASEKREHPSYWTDDAIANGGTRKREHTVGSASAAMD